MHTSEADAEMRFLLLNFGNCEVERNAPAFVSDNPLMATVHVAKRHVMANNMALHNPAAHSACRRDVRLGTLVSLDKRTMWTDKPLLKNRVMELWCPWRRKLARCGEAGSDNLTPVGRHPHLSIVVEGFPQTEPLL